MIFEGCSDAEEKLLTLKVAEDGTISTSDGQVIGKADNKSPALEYVGSVDRESVKSANIKIVYNQAGILINGSTVLFGASFDKIQDLLGNPSRVKDIFGSTSYTFDELGIRINVGSTGEFEVIIVTFREGHWEYSPTKSFNSIFQINDIEVADKTTYEQLKSFGLEKYEYERELCIMKDADKTVHLRFDSTDNGLVSIWITRK